MEKKKIIAVLLFLSFLLQPCANMMTVSAAELYGTKTGKQASFSVTFQSNGGSAVKTQKVSSGKTVKKPQNPTRRNYLFAGWYSSGKKYDFSQKVTRNLTLTAKWTKVTLSKGRIANLKLKNQKTGSTVILAGKISGAAGYEFVYYKNEYPRKVKTSILSKSNKVTIGYLKKGCLYCVKVRGFRYDSTGRKVYGKFSDVTYFLRNR